MCIIELLMNWLFPQKRALETENYRSAKRKKVTNRSLNKRRNTSPEVSQGPVKNKNRHENQNQKIVTEPEEVDYDEGTRKVMTVIAEFKKSAQEFEKLIENFDDVKGSQSHYYIEESLLRIVLQLDKVKVGDNEMLREKRKSVIKYIYQLFDKLKLKSEKK